jgi:hypothetical protein
MIQLTAARLSLLPILSKSFFLPTAILLDAAYTPYFPDFLHFFSVVHFVDSIEIGSWNPWEKAARTQAEHTV